MYYILVETEGKVYNKLLNHIQHHSLAQLLIELLQIKIGNSNSKQSADWDKDDKSEEEKHTEEPAEELPPLDAKMASVLKSKKQEVITTLLTKLSGQSSDLEECLNAHTVL